MAESRNVTLSRHDIDVGDLSLPFSIITIIIVVRVCTRETRRHVNFILSYRQAEHAMRYLKPRTDRDTIAEKHCVIETFQKFPSNIIHINKESKFLICFHSLKIPKLLFANFFLLDCIQNCKLAIF